MKSLIYILLSVMALSLNLVRAQSLDSLLNEAVQNHPELKALQAEYEAQLQQATQVEQLPDAELGIGVPILPPETRLGPQLLTLKASQMFPWFGTQTLKSDIVLDMSRANFERIAMFKLDLFHSIRVSYYNLYLAELKQKLITDHLKNHRVLKSIILANIDAGKASVADVLRLQARINQLTNDSATIESNKIALSARIYEAIGTSDTRLIKVENLPDTPSELNIDTVDFRRKIVAHHPMMKQINAKIEASKKKQELNEKSGMPMIGLGVDYTVVGERTDANPDQNGRDILAPKAMITLPINRNKYKAIHKEEELLQVAFEADQRALENKLLRLVTEYMVEHNDAIRNIGYLRSQKELTTSIHELLLTEYSSDGLGFDEILITLNELYKYDFELASKTVQTYLIEARIQQITAF